MTQTIQAVIAATGLHTPDQSISNAELVAAALILYPVYVGPNGWPCEAEDLVEALIAAKGAPPPRAPANQITRWWTGIRASLDRTPPPSY